MVLWQWDLEEMKHENKRRKRVRVTWERRRGFQERLKSKVAFMITLRWAQHRRHTAELTGLGTTQAQKHTHAHTIMRNHLKQNGRCMHIHGRHALASNDSYRNTCTHQDCNGIGFSQYNNHVRKPQLVHWEWNMRQFCIVHGNTTFLWLLLNMRIPFITLD